MLILIKFVFIINLYNFKFTGLVQGELRATNTIYFIYDNKEKTILVNSFDQFECKIKNKYKLTYE